MSDDGSPQRTPDFRTAVEDVKALATVFAMEAESILGRRTVRVLGVLVLFAVVVGILLALLDWYIAPTDANQKQALVVTIAQILGGAALLSGLYFTWRTLQVNREGQITERFTRAIDQLGATDDDGNPRLEIRLGGIYALERIARDSARDYGQIMEILTAYLRENSPWPPKDATVLPSAERKAHEWARWRKTETVSFITGAATDVQAVLDVLGRREETRVPTAYRVSFDLTETDLQGANLSGMNLAGVSLVGANLRGAWLVRANLERADLTGANLQQAWLSDARLTRARLTDARLEGAHLSGATIHDPSLQLTRIFRFDELSEIGSIVIEATDLSETQGLVEEQLGLTVGETFIKLPQGFQPPSTWLLDTQEQVEIIREQMKILDFRAPDDH